MIWDLSPDFPPCTLPPDFFVIATALRALWPRSVANTLTDQLFKPPLAKVSPNAGLKAGISRKTFLKQWFYDFSQIGEIRPAPECPDWMLAVEAFKAATADRVALLQFGVFA